SATRRGSLAPSVGLGRSELGDPQRRRLATSPPPHGGAGEAADTHGKGDQMTLELWPHQRAAVDAAKGAFANGGQARGLWVMPTGSGKTVAFATLARELDVPTLVVVRRGELARQVEAAFGHAWAEAHVGCLPGEDWGSSTVLVAPVQSLQRKLGQIPADRFRLVVSDEAHHGAAASWRKGIGHFEPNLLLGCTASPKGLDGEDILP